MSVRFYKRLFLLIFISIILAPAFLAVRLAFSVRDIMTEQNTAALTLSKLQGDVALLQSNLSQLTLRLDLPKPTPMPSLSPSHEETTDEIPSEEIPTDFSDADAADETPPRVTLPQGEQTLYTDWSQSHTGSYPSQTSYPSAAAPTAPALANANNPEYYRTLYPELYVKTPAPSERYSILNTAYLTFDDSPSEHTEKILDELDKVDVKATFFLVGKTDEDSVRRVKEILSRGHAIGIHTYSHDYAKIYESVEAYLSDFNQIFQHIYKETGEKPELFRFPGGSVNSYNSSIFKKLIEEMGRRGFIYHDWNVTGDDTLMDATKENIIASVNGKLDGKRRVVLLLHDEIGKTATIEALSPIVSELRNRGFKLEPLSSAVEPITFIYK